MPERKKKILIIEDDKDYRNLLYEQLTDAGYYVVMASDTGGATDWALRKELSPVDMIISDQRMPGEQGSEFLTFLMELRKNDPGKLDSSAPIYGKLKERFGNLADKDFRGLLKEIGAPSCKKVILSGYAENDLIREAREKGAIDAFISKKEDEDVILGQIASLLAGS